MKKLEQYRIHFNFTHLGIPEFDIVISVLSLRIGALSLGILALYFTFRTLTGV